MTSGTAITSTTHADWALYYGASNYMCVGENPTIFDYNLDGYGDLMFNSGYYSGYSSYADHGKWAWIIDGSASPATGTKRISDSTSYTRRFFGTGCSGFGAHAFGDYDGDGLPDLMLGSTSPGKVFVLLNNQISPSGQTVEVTAISTFTIYAPSSASYFAYPGDPVYKYYYYPIYNTLVFWNRDSDGCDDIFVSAPTTTSTGASYAGMVYGISNFDMFGIGKFESGEGSLPDRETYYAEMREYTFSGSAWNRWNIFGTEQMTWDLMLGKYHAKILYTNPQATPDTGIIQVVDDTWGIIRMDPDSLSLTANYALNTLFVKFNITFTLDLPTENDLNVDFMVACKHMKFTQTFTEVGKVRNRFKFVGNLEAYTDPSWYVPPGRAAGTQTLFNGDWVSENTTVQLTGMRLIYNGTEDFMEDFEEEPFYPRNDLFKLVMTNTFGDTVEDNSSSGRDFSLSLNAGSMSMEVTFKVNQVGLPLDKVMNTVPNFKIKVDTDTPTAPSGVKVRADAFDDPNLVVDNDGELFITWTPPGEYYSGIDYYIIDCTGSEGPIETESNFGKISTTATGEIEVMVWAVDRVGHKGPAGLGKIFIDSQMLSFSDFLPSEDSWANSLTPEVTIRITDLGGRAVIGSSVEYSISFDEGANFGPWMGAESVLNSMVLDVKVYPLLMEGDANMVKFKASDEAGNTLESEAHTVKTDISGVQFEDMTVDGSADWEETWLPSGTVDLSITIFDTNSGVDAGTIQYKLTTRGRSDLNSLTWIDMNGETSGQSVKVDMDDLELAMGYNNYIQFRAKDVVGNAYSFSPAYNIWIDTEPIPIISSPEEGMEFLEGEMVTFDAIDSTDVDGDILTYTWMDEVTFKGNTTTEELGADLEVNDRFDIALKPGEHTITLILSDGVHEVASDPLHIVVEERIVPIWLSMEDTDNDGMPNFWEYTYYLGWDDSSNSDDLYDPSTQAGIQRSQLYSLLEPKFKNGSSVVTVDNDADGDGHTDFEEYLWGSDPTNALDYPIYAPPGKGDKNKNDLFIMGLIIACVIVLLIVLALMLFNYSSMKAKMRKDEIREAQEEKQLAESRMLAGGSERLAALKSASEGNPVALPASMPAAQPALPEAPQPTPVQAQPMEAQAMTAQPMQAVPIQPAPAPVTQQPPYGQGPM
ncbi:MAG: hypothetical protein LUQ69_09695 [Methanoregulaceae archaeon]|nr:hypothetical protein [Methanoregulaceae archaeon]